MVSENNTPSIPSKALPPLSKDDDLPLPPSPPQASVAAVGPPPPPPKITLDSLPVNSDNLGPKDGVLSAPGSPLREALSPYGSGTPPGSPAFSIGSSSTMAPPSPTIDSSRPKKLNPFVDLLETEKTYVDILSGIIRKVAAAWSRSNLPPPQLDSMFRAVEAVFKANRHFLSKLKEIGPNPSSPRVIGDLLMKWIDQLDTPYTNYCSVFLAGFDTWEPVQSNPRLQSVLETFSASNPPPANGPPQWTLDALFALPRSRIKYYQKLYNRLLKNSAPGKSTDRLLVQAVAKLEELVRTAEERTNISLPGPSAAIETTDEVVVDLRSDSGETSKEMARPPAPERSETLKSEETVRLQEPVGRTSIDSSIRSSSLSSGQRSSRDTSLTSEGRASTATLSMSMADLERRLATERCRDLFTMNPRSVRLSINSSHLPYSRELRLSEDAEIHFTPRSTSVGIIHRHGHVFLLTDLLLVCERMSAEDRAHTESETADVWLCYPPLAAKHLRASTLDDNTMEIAILKKEVMIIRFASSSKRDYVLKEFQSTVNLALALPPPSKQPPPPLPSLNGPKQPPNEGENMDRQQSVIRAEPFSPHSSIASSRAMSPISGDSSMHRIVPMRSLTSSTSPPPTSWTPSLSAGSPPPSGPPPYTPLPSGVVLAPQPCGPSFVPGQVIPPQRNESARPPPNVGLPSRPNVGNGPQSFGPGQIIPPPRGQSVRSPPPSNGMPPLAPPPRSNSMGSGPYSNGPGPGGPYPPSHPNQQPGISSRQNSLTAQGPPIQRRPSPGPFPHPGQPGPATRQYPPGQPGPGHMPGQYPPLGLNGQIPPNQMISPHAGPPFANNMTRTPSDPSFQGEIRKSPSTRSLGSQYDRAQPPQPAPPVPDLPNGFPPGQLRPLLPSAALPRIASAAPGFTLDASPPPSPTEEIPSGPIESAILATMKCKVFLQQHHAQWKSLGTAKLTLYEQRPTMVKQLVVEADNKDKTMLISTIVLTDGVERVGKTGVAIELSDNGARTGIVYMIQLRNENSAGGLFDSLLAGSDRSAVRTR